MPPREALAPSAIRRCTEGSSSARHVEIRCRRRARQPAAPGRARMLHAAAAPEAHRGGTAGDRPAMRANRRGRRYSGQTSAIPGRGEVEFVYDEPTVASLSRMNTRIQVEHGDEMVTGRDLVSEQIRIAAGNRSPSARTKVHQGTPSVPHQRRGSQLCALARRLLAWARPRATRVDTHCFPDTVPPFYDSLPPS